MPNTSKIDSIIIYDFVSISNLIQMDDKQSYQTKQSVRYDT